MDEVLVREENVYWKWQVTRFGTPTMFFARKAVGEWWVNEREDGKIHVRWRYTYHATNVLTKPFNWLFVRMVWRKVMQNGMLHIKEMAEAGMPFLYS